MRIKKQQGSIIARETSSKTKNRRLYITFKGKRISTGLDDTKAGWAKARDILQKMNEESVNKRFGLSKKQREVTVYQAFALYITERKNTRARKTVEADGNAFKAFFPKNFLLTETIIREGREVSLLEIYLRKAITENRKSSSTLHIYLRSINVFIGWLYEEGYIKHLIHVKKLAKLIRSEPKKPIRVYTDQEIQLITQSLRKTHYSLLASAIELMVHTGMRIHEVLEMRWSDIYKDTIRIESKDHTQTQVVIVTDNIKKIIESIPHKGDKLFPWSTESDGRLRNALYNAMKENNIPRDKRSFHEMRKTFITRLIVYNANMTLFDIAVAARCKISVIEQHYLKYPVERLRLLLEQ